ncbi:MAG: hypothetical protein RR248_00040 [Clostridia bacterium]
MATNFLGLFASQYNFKYYHSRVYGTFNGYDVCLAMQGGMLACYFNTQVVEINSFISTMEENAQRYGIVTFRMSPPIVSVFASTDDIVAVLNFITQLLRLCKSSTSELCSFCGERLNQEERIYFSVEEVVCVSHYKCYEKFVSKLSKERDELKKELLPWHKVILTPFLFAFIIMLATVMITKTFLTGGLYVMLAGMFAMGFMASKRYFDKGGKGGMQSLVSLGIMGFVLVFCGFMLLYVYQYSSNGILVALKQFFTVKFAQQVLYITFGIALYFVGVLLKFFNNGNNYLDKKINIHKI